VRALRLYPGLTPLAALVASVKHGAPLKPATARIYKQEVATVIERLVENGQASKVAAANAADAIQRALLARSRQPSPAKTSTLKVHDACQAEVAAVLGALEQQAGCAERQGGRATLARLLLALVTVSPVLGLRPTEWVGARVDGLRLIVPCAKVTNGRGLAAERPLVLGGLHESIVLAVRVVIDLMPQALDAHGGNWRRVLKALAERLARACETATVRRLSLYSFRHVAIATWKARGLPPAVIAALAGHRSTRTARSWYAGGRDGWEVENLPEADPALVALADGRRLEAASESQRERTANVEPALDDRQEAGSPPLWSNADEDPLSPAPALWDPFGIDELAMPMPLRPVPAPSLAAADAQDLRRRKAAEQQAELAGILDRMRAGEPRGTALGGEQLVQRGPHPSRRGAYEMEPDEDPGPGGPGRR
jgi:integrase